MLGFMLTHSRTGLRRGQRLAIGLLAGAIAVHSAHAADEKPAEGNAATRTANKAANATERTAKKAVDATERTAKRAAGAVERGAKKTDKALTNAAEKTDNWVKQKTK
jgi:hypothetical protein